MSRSFLILAFVCGLVLGGFLLHRGIPDGIVTVTPRVTSAGAAPSASPRTPGPPPAFRTPRPAADPYVNLARQLSARGVQVWFEADLVSRWLQGPQAFAEGIDRLGRLSHVRGVVGFKVADELGYGDGINSPAQATAFLQAVHDGLARVAPRAQVLVDVVVPELGCLAWTKQGSASCAAEQRAKHPGATEAAVSGYLHQGLVDRLDLSTSMLDEWTYRSWGLSQPQAQRAAWEHVKQLGWQHLTALQSRKALADAGGYQGSPEEADTDVHTFVGVPTAEGARAVDVWTWRQQYDGRTVSLLDNSLQPNPLWQRLAAEHRAGVHLITHITPSLLLPTAAQRSREYALLASVFDAAFVAAGTGG